MILHCDFEELQALNRGAEFVLVARQSRSPSLMLVSDDAIARVDDLRPLLVGSITIADLQEVDSIQTAVQLIARTLQQMMQTAVLEYHPAHEEAVGLYFDYAHVFGVEHRVNDMAAEMHALADLMGSGSAVGNG
ncbi:hypothetical protein BH23GEM6_BH23GEM6_21740 [soil metagenome]